MVCAMFAFASCEDYTELDPKGQNLLSSVSDIEMLFNHPFSDRGFNFGDDQELIGDQYTSFTNIPNLIVQPQQSLKKIIFTWDESADREAYTNSDYKYATYYEIIGTICNPALAQLETASGDEATKKQLKAEALVLRAYMGWLSVCHFAKWYNASTAANDGGVPYPHEEDLVSEPCTQYSVKEVYDFINKDLDEALALNSLPDKSANQMRVSKAFAYAVKAMVQMAMGNYSEANQAASQSLAINGTISDYNDYIVDALGMDLMTYQYKTIQQLNRPKMEMEEDLFFTYNSPMYACLTPEYTSMFEEGSIFSIYAATDLLTYGMYYVGPMYYGLYLPCIAYNSDFSTNDSGLRTVDMYLIQAEVALRNGNIDESMGILDKIRQKRIVPASYAPLQGTITTKADAIAKFKQISRTENVFTIKNYLNLKRWNTESEWQTTITKTVNGTTFTLSPSSPLWIWTIPQNAINNNPNLKQNY